MHNLNEVYDAVEAEMPEFRDPDTAFDEAVEAGRLSVNPDSLVYAGRYMYMGTWDGVDAFKNIRTRKYLK